ncbi:TPA: DUF6379 domain-containing protein [Klebsiella oxytoca]
MFDNNIFIKDSCRNIYQDEKVLGYELQTNIPYYRGIPLSMVNEILVKENDEIVKREIIQCSLDKKQWFTLNEMTTVTSYKWEFGYPLYIRVNKADGLAGGIHDIELTVSIRTAYIPVPIIGVMARKVVI